VTSPLAVCENPQVPAPDRAARRALEVAHGSNEERTPAQESPVSLRPNLTPRKVAQQTQTILPVSGVQGAGDNNGRAQRSDGVRNEAGRQRIVQGTPYVSAPFPFRAAGKDDGPFYESESDIEPECVAVVQPSHPAVELGEPIDVGSLGNRNGLERRELSLLGLG
jgi:hypothetical protein